MSDCCQMPPLLALRAKRCRQRRDATTITLIFQMITPLPHYATPMPADALIFSLMPMLADAAIFWLDYFAIYAIFATPFSPPDFAQIELKSRALLREAD
jgi:hypothetical protein